MANKDEASRLLALAGDIGVSRVALQGSDLRKLTDSSSSDGGLGLSLGSSSSDSDTAPLPAARLSPTKKGSAPKVPGLEDSSIDSDSGLLDSSGDSDTVRLSLPGSFDDTLNFESIAVHSGIPRGQYEGLGGEAYDFLGGGRSGPSSQKLLDRVSDLEQELTKQRLRHESEVGALKARYEEQRSKDGAGALERDRELGLMQQRLADRKANFRDLAISEELFKELDDLPEAQLTLKEFVCVEAHRTVQSYKRELSETRKKVAQATEQLQTNMDTSDSNLRAALRAKKVAEGKEESLRLDLAHSESRLKEVEASVHTLQRTVGDLREKGRKYDETLNRAKSAEKKYDELRKLAEDQASALNTAADNEKKVVQRSVDSEHQLQLLQMDKTFLQKEVEVTSLRAEKAEKDHARCEDQLRESIVKRDELLMQLSEARHAGKGEYEHRLEREVKRLREDALKEMEDIKASAVQLREREASVLREARYAATESLNRANADLAELRTAHETLVLQHAASKASADAAVLEVRNDLKMASFEAARLTASLAAAQKDLKESNLHADHVSEQLSAHKSSFTLLQSETSSLLSQKDSLIKDLNDQLSVYLTAEARYADTIESGGDPGDAASALSAPRARVKHAMDLSRRLEETARAADEARSKVDELEATVERLRLEAGKARDVVEMSSQPQKYALEGYEAKAREVEVLERRLGEVVKERDGLKAELGRLLERRGGVERAIEMVGSLGLAVVAPDGTGRDGMGKVEEVGRMEDDDDDDDEGDLSVHLSRHEGGGDALYHERG